MQTQFGEVDRLKMFVDGVISRHRQTWYQRHQAVMARRLW